MLKKLTAILLAALTLCALAACGARPSGEADVPETGEPTAPVISAAPGEPVPEETEAPGGVVTGLEKLDMSRWEYKASDDVYYQTGVVYCESPANKQTGTLAIFVPGGYFSAKANGDGTFTCSVDTSAEVNGYTAETAPVVMPINTPGYMAQAPLTAYRDVTEYTDEGFVYVHAACRGRDSGAPAGVTDLKAAIRYLRYTDDVLAGSAERIFVFGMSGGGAQSALLGATGDSALYEPYLEQIGAVRGVSDAVCGSMDWCPITNLDSADAAYEWMMGVTRSGLSAEEQAVSDALAAAFAGYINRAGIRDEKGNVLTLEQSEDGVYQAGSYYDYIVSAIEYSLNDFLSYTEFPYEVPRSMGMMQGPPGNRDGISRDVGSDRAGISGTYATVQDYLDAMNASGTWVTYDYATNTAKITGVADFVRVFKKASKSLGAFDQLNAGQGENTLFGYGDGRGAHFNAALAGILDELGSEYAAKYASDLQRTDSAGYTAEQRLNMYTPLYYLLESEEGYGTSTPAKYWRIRSGINQSDTAVTTEVNLSLALMNYDGVESVDFAMVWGLGHVEAERAGDSGANFIRWVHECLA